MEDMENLIARIREMQVSKHKTMANGVCRKRTPVQPPEQVPVKTAGDRRQRKRTNRGSTPRGQFRAEWTALRRERVYNNAGRNLREMKARRRRNKKKGPNQCNVTVPFTRKGRSPRNRSNGGMHVGYSGRATFVRKQLDMRPESQNCGARATPRRRLMLGNGSVNTFPQQQIRTQYRNWRRNFLFNQYRSLWRRNGFRTVGHRNQKSLCWRRPRVNGLDRCRWPAVSQSAVQYRNPRARKQQTGSPMLEAAETSTWRQHTGTIWNAL
jgi:hypothetical protein